MNDLASTWGRIAILASRSGLAFDSLEQQPQPVYEITAAGRLYRLDLNPNSNNIAASSVEMAFNDISRCQFTEDDPPEGDWSLEGQLTVRAWLTGTGGFPASVQVGDADMYTALEGLNGGYVNLWRTHRGNLSRTRLLFDDVSGRRAHGPFALPERVEAAGPPASTTMSDVEGDSAPSLREVSDVFP